MNTDRTAAELQKRLDNLTRFLLSGQDSHLASKIIFGADKNYRAYVFDLHWLVPEDFSGNGSDIVEQIASPE